jgi:hypothetical protein
MDQGNLNRRLELGAKIAVDLGRFGVSGTTKLKQKTQGPTPMRRNLGLRNRTLWRWNYFFSASL